MTKLTKEVTEIAKELMGGGTLTYFESLQIAAKIQQNRMYHEAYLLEIGGPSALEAIAMQLGAGNGYSIQTAITSIADAISQSKE